MATRIYEILNNIVFIHLDFYDKHTFQKVNSYTKKINIVDLSEIDEKYLARLDDIILRNYNHATKLSTWNPKISKINDMIKLKELHMICHCMINNDDMTNLSNLEILDMVKTKELIASNI